MDVEDDDDEDETKRPITWEPNKMIQKALNDAFYMSFKVRLQYSTFKVRYCIL